MLREIGLEEISDGRLYGLNDMVRAGCGGCSDCSACCHGMGVSAVLDPFDVYRLAAGLKKPVSQLFQEGLELNVVDGIILPNLKMAGEQEACYFLDSQGRCSIHPYRPGVCRLFPLGRYYENGSFRYFLQVRECAKENRAKVKVRKWIDTPDLGRYEQYISDWHYFLKGLQGRVTGQNAKEVSVYVLHTFYLTEYGAGTDFYGQFGRRLAEAAAWRDGL